MTDIIIRKYNEKDADEVLNLIHRNSLEINAKDYGLEFMQKFVDICDVNWLSKRASFCHMYVAEENGSIVGVGGISSYFGSLTESIILNVFVLPEYHGKDIGRKIVQTLEKDEYGIRASRIEVPASITAKEFYYKLGYKFKNGVEELDEEKHYRMEKFKPQAIIIKPLTAELNKDYLSFFDNRAFTDDNPNGPCYCTSPNQDEESIKKMVKKFKIFGVKKTLRKYAVKMLNENKIQGYLAFDGDTSIGWCNAADIESYSGFVPQFAKDNTCGKTFSIVCFEIAPEYRGKGIASAFIERVCNDAKEKGYVAVEGYAKLTENRDNFDFQGPVQLYKKAGFIEVARENGQAIMRKML